MYICAVRRNRDKMAILPIILLIDIDLDTGVSQMCKELLLSDKNERTQTSVSFRCDKEKSKLYLYLQKTTYVQQGSSTVK